jgi:hypothetical protein
MPSREVLRKTVTVEMVGKLLLWTSVGEQKLDLTQ